MKLGQAKAALFGTELKLLRYGMQLRWAELKLRPYGRTELKLLRYEIIPSKLAVTHDHTNTP